MRNYLFALLLIIGIAPAIKAQDSAWTEPVKHYTFTLDSTTIMLGDQTVLSITPEGQFPSLDELSNNGIIAVRQWIDSTDGTLLTALTSFEPGEHWYHIGTDSVRITVNDVANVDTTTVNIKDINGILRQPYTFWEIFRWVLLALGIAIIAIAVWYFVRRYKKKEPLFPVHTDPPLPADQRALRDLEQLRLKQLWQQGKAKEYHTELTDIVRTYLNEAFGIQSVEMTTDQTLDIFRDSSAYTPDTYELLQQMLQLADMVKFAKSEPLPHQHDLSLTHAVDFINQTNRPINLQ